MQNVRLTMGMFLALLMCLTSGCYLHRMTYNYDGIQELEDAPEALMDVSGITPEEQDKLLQEVLKQYEKRDIVFTINAGDVLDIRVYDNPDLSYNQIVVTPDGYIGVGLVGQVQVGGLTMVEANAKLEKLLGEYIVNPRVTIMTHSVRSETATITGAVNNSGMFVISSGMRLADLYALAGGSSVRNYNGQWLDAAVLESSLLVRDGKVMPVNFTRAIKHGDPLHNVLLRKNDYVYIPAKDDNMVYVIGDVQSPQRCNWNENMGLLELLASCGWVNETFWDHAIIIRGGFADPQMFKVDLGGILKGKKRNVRILAGDIVYLPKDDLSEYNVFVRKLMPTIQLIRGGRYLY
ncbi:MAG: polysaccharide biosynthesis/export family protein [Victivallales bacterium]|nr:polysaccharide biosynthesis/export family protein [Victivallales bacterium]